MKCALSPCPNDTFLFFAWIHGLVGQNLPLEPTYADIEQLNRWALTQRFPLIKLSFGCFAQTLEHYQLLPVGSALGFNCGPKIISQTAFPLEELEHKKIAVPGKNTTAKLLLNQLELKSGEIHYCLYHEIPSLIASQTVDCGLIIHESRFTFSNQGFVEIADLGTLWHEKTGLPLPLGGLAVLRTTPKEVKKQIVAALRDSLAFAKQHPGKALPFILSKAQEKEIGVVEKHIATYVNQESEQLSDWGLQAIERLIHPQTEWLLDV